MGHITLVVDRSGSMAATRDDAEGGISEFVKKQAEESDPTITLYQFDTTYEKVYGPVKASEAPSYSLEPRGMTALYDAVGKGISDTKEITSDKIVVVIVTDGMENSSTEYTHEAMKKAIDDAKGKGWEVIFLASDPEVVDMGRAAGMRTMSYDPATQTRGTYAVTGQSISSYFEGDTENVDLPDVAEDES